MPRQRHIPLNIDVRDELDRRKRDYEDRTGDTGDWGKFLGLVSLAGLAALGIYRVAQANRLTPTVWQVDCLQCRMGFAIQVPNPPPWRMSKVRCPNCGGDLVIDFVGSATIVSSEHEKGMESAYTIECHFCRQPIKAASSNVNPQAIEYLECTRCGRMPRMRSQ